MPYKATASLLTGLNGATYIDGTGATTPVGDAFCAIQALTATVLDQSVITQANTNWKGFDVVVTIPAGTIVYGRFKTITLVSGTCLAYEI